LKTETHINTAANAAAIKGYQSSSTARPSYSVIARTPKRRAAAAQTRLTGVSRAARLRV
jgi:hypothetical protein